MCVGSEGQLTYATILLHCKIILFPVVIFLWEDNLDPWFLLVENGV